MRVANLITETLVRAGVTRIFSLSGNQIMPIYDACIDSGLPIVHVRHESAAVYMAEAWAQMTGETGVALVTAGGGFTNALGAMYSAVCSESPVLLISGDSPLNQDGAGAFQELDQVAMASTVSKTAVRLASATGTPETFAQVIRTAHVNRPGPVHVAVPFDLVNEDAAVSTSELDQLSFRESLSDTDRCNISHTVEQVVQRLSTAKHPVLVTGPAHNTYRAAGRDEMDRLSRVVPVIPMESPRGLRDPSLGDIASVFKAADVVVLLGKAVDFTLSFAGKNQFSEAVEFMVVDPDKAICDQAKRTLNHRAILIEQGNTQEVLTQLTPMMEALGDEWTEWRGQVATWVSRRCTAPVELADESEEKEGIHPAVLCQKVQNFLSGEKQTVAICDGGEFGQWSQAGLSVPMRIINGTSGVIGAGPSYGIAAKLSLPDATVIVFVGDGTVGFYLAEIETAIRHEIPVIIVVGHDSRWNAEVQIQRRDYGDDRLIGCELADTRYDLVVAAMGGHGEYVSRSAELQQALERAVASGKPACINVRLNGQPAPNVC